MSLGIWQIVLILLIIVIIFGAGKLPTVMGDVAKGVKNFKAGMKDEEVDASKLASDSTAPMNETNKDKAASS
ncbi:MAG: twin-arginine translocase TatA/TatE family subunit [Pseudomonadota bacterium]